MVNQPLTEATGRALLQAIEEMKEILLSGRGNGAQAVTAPASVSGIKKRKSYKSLITPELVDFVAAQLGSKSFAAYIPQSMYHQA